MTSLLSYVLPVQGDRIVFGGQHMRVGGRRTPHRAGSFCNLRSDHQLVLHRITAGTGACHAGSYDMYMKDKKKHVWKVLMIT